MANSMSRMPPWPVLTSLSARRRASAVLLLDPPLQRLDLVDLGEAEILAVDERLDRLEELLAQVAGRRRPAGP